MGAEPPRLTCRACATTHGADERFCPACGLPLVHADAEGDLEVTERHARARKVRPQYSEGELVRVAGSRHQAEAELIQNMLLEEGIPSMLRRAAGFDVPDMLAAGPRDVLVPASGVQAAREVLLQGGLEAAPPQANVDGPGRILAILLVIIAVVAIVVILGSALL